MFNYTDDSDDDIEYMYTYNHFINDIATKNDD